MLDLENFLPQQVIGALVQSTNLSAVILCLTPVTVEHVMAECTSLLYIGRLQPANSITLICSEHVVQVVSTLLCSS